jgi:hypothetical protein
VTDVGIRAEGGEGDARASQCNLYIANGVVALPVGALFV